MKTPASKTEETSALEQRNFTPGKLLDRINTVRSHVLASLLESKVLTGMDSVFQQSTTRLAAVIHVLKHKYSWPIECHDVAVGTTDGRVETITSYWLRQETIAKAFDEGARDWVDSVKAARAERRKESEKCKSKAARMNAACKSRKPENPRQGNLWGNV